MPKLTDIAASTTQRVLIYGPPKSGKSELAGRLSEKFNLLWFDFENGYSTLRKLPELWQSKIDVFSIPDSRTFPIGIETALKLVKSSGPISLCHSHGKVSCALCAKDPTLYSSINLAALTNETIVVFDSLTQLTNSAIASITKNQPEDYKLNYDDWARLGMFLDTFLSQLQQAKYHVVVITHETESEMEDGKMKLVPTAGTRNFSRNTAKYFDHVIYAEVKNRKHVFGSTTTYAPNILSGSRSGISMETSETASLLPIFTGVVGTNGDKLLTANTQGQAAAKNIAGLVAAPAGTGVQKK